MTPKQARVKPVRRRRRRWVILIIILIVLGAGGWVGRNMVADRVPAETVTHHYDQAVAFHEQGDVQSAVIELKKVLQQNPEHREARWLLGQVSLELGQGAAAQKEIERARALGRQGPEVEHALLRARLLQRQFSEVLQRLSTNESNETDTLILRGEAQLGLGMLDEAQASFMEVHESERENAKAAQGLGRIALLRGDYVAAEQALDSVTESRDDLEMWLLKGDIGLAKSDFERARNAYGRALGLRDNHVGARLGLSRALLGLGQSTKAEDYLAPLYEANPKTPVVNYLLAVAARQENELDRAKTLLREVLSVSPRQPDSLLLLGSIYFVEKEFEAAEESVSQVVDVVPGHLPSRKLLGVIQMARRHPERAIRTLRTALELAPEDAQLLALLGSAHMNHREFDKGAHYLERAMKLAPDVAAVRTQLAVSRLGSGAAEQAVSGLHSAIELDPTFVQADILLIVTHLLAGAFDKALRVAKQFAEKHPDNPTAYNLMGRAYQGKHELDNARTAYERALSIAPGYVSVLLNLGRIDLLEGNSNAARNRYESMLASVADQPQALMALAELERKEGRPGEELALLERASQRNPASIEPQLMLANAYIRLGRAREALAVAVEAHRLAASNPLTTLTLGRAQLASGDGETALATLTPLAQEFPDSVETHFYLGSAYRALRRLYAARLSFQKVLELNREYLPAKVALGNLALLEGDTQEALETALRLQKAHPQAADGYALQGDVKMAAKQYGEAITAYTSALERTPGNRLLIALHHAHRALGDHEQAEQTLRTWLGTHPEDVAVRSVLAHFAQVSGEKTIAIQEYNRMLGQAPKNVLALNNLAYLYQEQGDAQALELAERAFKLAPNHPDVMDTYGWLLVKNGQADRGVVILNQAVKRAPDVHENRFHLAVGLAKAGKVAEARRELMLLIETGAQFSEKEKAEELLRILR